MNKRKLASLISLLAGGTLAVILTQPFHGSAQIYNPHPTPPSNSVTNAMLTATAVGDNVVDPANPITAEKIATDTTLQFVTNRADTINGAKTFASSTLIGGTLNVSGTISQNGTAVSVGNYFTGNGQDGALNVNNGTTTISFGGLSVLSKQYTTFSITSGTLNFSNPASNGSTFFVRTTGNCTITQTSSINAIDLTGMGALGSATGTGSLGSNNGAGGGGGASMINNGSQGGSGIGGVTGSDNGTDAFGYADVTAGQGAITNTGGLGGLALPTSSFTTSTIFMGTHAIVPGSGGGGGSNSNEAFGAPGGNGGGSLWLQCGGALSFGTGATIITSGNVGTVGTSTHNNGEGGGGGAGSVVIIWSTLTNNSGTITTTGGAGGTGHNGAGSGGNGGNGYQLVTSSTMF